MPKIRLTRASHIANGKEYKVYDENHKPLIHEVSQELIDTLDACRTPYEIVKEEEKKISKQ